MGCAESKQNLRKFDYALNDPAKKSKHITTNSLEIENLGYHNDIWLDQATRKKNTSFSDNKWVKKMIPSTSDIASNIETSDYTEISSTINKNDYTHTGLIQYLAIAWAKEKGIVLRPDMLHHQITCEIASHIIKNPYMYKELYTNSNDKTEIIIENSSNNDDDFIKLLDDVLNKSIIDKEFKKLFTDINFESQPKEYEMVKRICFCHSATPYYNYFSTLCGFPSISISNIYKDWIILYNFVTKMLEIITKKCNPEIKYEPIKKKIITYLSNCIKHIVDIVNNFEKNAIIKKKLNNIFYIEDVCESGHVSPYYIRGWITDFYYEKHPKLSDYPARLPYVPYTLLNFTESNDYYSIITGLTSSKLNENILESEYGRVVLKINNEQLFKIIKN